MKSGALSLFKSLVPICEIIWSGFSLIDGVMGLHVIFHAPTLDLEKLLIMRTSQFSDFFEISYPLTYLIMLSPRTTILFFSADVLESLLLTSLSYFSLPLVLIALSTRGFLMTDSGCEIMSSVAVIC